MAQTVTIPVGFHPLEITINNTKYVYKEGETVSVPDEVAALVKQYIAAQPVPKPNSLIDNLGLAFQRSDKGKAFKVKDDGTDVEWGEVSPSGGESGSGLPDISAGDAGKVLTVNEDETGAEWASSGGGIFWVTATEVEQDDSFVLITLDKTFLEIYTAMQNRYLCVIIYDRHEDPPISYEARHEVVMETVYEPLEGGATVYAQNTFTCASINDYPAFVD